MRPELLRHIPVLLNYVKCGRVLDCHTYLPLYEISNVDISAVEAAWNWFMVLPRTTSDGEYELRLSQLGRKVLIEYLDLCK